MPGFVYQGKALFLTLRTCWRERVARATTPAQLVLYLKALAANIRWNEIFQPAVPKARDSTVYTILARRDIHSRVEYKLRTDGLLDDGSEGTQVTWVDETEVPHLYLVVQYEMRGITAEQAQVGQRNISLQNVSTPQSANHARQSVMPQGPQPLDTSWPAAISSPQAQPQAFAAPDFFGFYGAGGSDSGPLPYGSSVLDLGTAVSYQQAACRTPVSSSAAATGVRNGLVDNSTITKLTQGATFNYFGQQARAKTAKERKEVERRYRDVTATLNSVLNKVERKLNRAALANGRKRKRPNVDEKASKLYCLCRTAYNAEEDYLGCERCDNWFHLECVGEVSVADWEGRDYLCPTCREGRAVKRLRLADDETTVVVPMIVKPETITLHSKNFLRTNLQLLVTHPAVQLLESTPRRRGFQGQLLDRIDKNQIANLDQLSTALQQALQNARNAFDQVRTEA